MFGWLSKKVQVTAMTRVIHEMCSYAHHSRDTFGAPLHKHFISYPMLTNHRAPAPTDRDQVHIFHLSDGRHSFTVMVHDGQDGGRAWVAVAPHEAFEGVSVQSSAKGRYMVRIEAHSARPRGPLAVRLKDAFVATHDALDTSV